MPHGGDRHVFWSVIVEPRRVPCLSHQCLFKMGKGTHGPPYYRFSLYSMFVLPPTGCLFSATFLHAMLGEMLEFAADIAHAAIILKNTYLIIHR